ncbi:MAG: HIRAN domain-containing protein [Clostridia bacterium]|nr:HIRAN domain-containing protein [Clostridia bacterium]MDD7673121.1 HIRAN domain-containing protein [Clostridia bacterium]MDY2930230.1 HIRAN domain-containing protein [Clostridiaceae bacterium]
MLSGIFITITGFKSYHGKTPFSIGAQLLCCKDPQNAYDSEAIRVLAPGGDTVGYVANSASTKANGTMSAARLYDHVGDRFLAEVCFTTQTKIICQIICQDIQDPALFQPFVRAESLDDVFQDGEN